MTCGIGGPGFAGCAWRDSVPDEPGTYEMLLYVAAPGYRTATVHATLSVPGPGTRSCCGSYPWFTPETVVLVHDP
jgi:hypothetical protein